MTKEEVQLTIRGRTPGLYGRAEVIDIGAGYRHMYISKPAPGGGHRGRVITFGGEHLLVIHGEDDRPLVTVEHDGTVVYGAGYEPDAAARVFWEAMGSLGMVREVFAESPPAVMELADSANDGIWRPTTKETA